jgi:CheY-like chemotaxis protein
MKILKCLIVDDEPPAIRLLESMLVKFLLELIGTTTSSEALSTIEEMLIWFYGYSNARSNWFAIVKIVKAKPILFYIAYRNLRCKAMKLMRLIIY